MPFTPVLPDLDAFRVVKPSDKPVRLEDSKLPDGTPMLGADGLLIPAARSFSMVLNASTRVFSYRYDEAMRDNFINARAMRRDAFIRGLLEERILPTINREFSLEVDDDRDPEQQYVKEGLARIIRATPKFSAMKRALLDAVWYGRAGAQWSYARNEEVDNLWGVHKWDPLHGDSVQFTFDGVPAILMDAMTTGWYAQHGAKYGPPGKADLEPTDRGGTALVLRRPYWRDRFAIHQHMLEKADYFEGELAGSVQGLGLRGLVYWQYVVRTDALTWMLAYMQAVGQMDLLIFNYPAGNSAAQQQQELNAQKIIGKAAIACPRDPKGNWPAVEQLPMNAAGLQALQKLVADYFDRHIERLIVGQSMSSGADKGTGLGGTGRADFARATKDEILVYDTQRLDETLTTDYVRVLKKYNFPWAKFPVRYKSILPDLQAQEKVMSGKVLISVGIPIKADELREAAGYSRPEAGDDVVGAPPPMAGPGGGPSGAPSPGGGQPPAPAWMGAPAGPPGGAPAPGGAPLMASRYGPGGGGGMGFPGGGNTHIPMFGGSDYNPRNSGKGLISTTRYSRLTNTGSGVGFPATYQGTGMSTNYNHEGFLAAIAKQPRVFTHRGAYADWLQENEPHVIGPKSLELLRDQTQTPWVHRTPEGQILAGRRWTMPEIKAVNIAAGKNWFSRDTMRFHGTRLLPKHVYSGPGGVYFVHEGDNFNRTAREYRIASFHPQTGETGSWSTVHADAAPPEAREGTLAARLSGEFAPNDPFGDQLTAVELAQQLAQGTSPYPKNRYWEETKHGASADYPLPPTQNFRGESPTAYGAHKLGCAYVHLEAESAFRVLQAAHAVKDTDLAPDGKELDAHVTIRYGFPESVTPSDILNKVKNFGRIKLRLGRCSLFESPEHDVVKFEVESEDLRRLNRILGALPHTDKHKDYRPHATAAYTLPGRGAQYAAAFAPLNLDFDIDGFYYSTPNGDKFWVSTTDEPPQAIIAHSDNPADVPTYSGQRPVNPTKSYNRPAHPTRYTTSEDEFHAMLDANPEDSLTRRVFADWLQERNDPRAEGYRAIGVTGLSPRNGIYGPHAAVPGAPYWMWDHRGPGYMGDGTDTPPNDWYDAVCHQQEYDGARPLWATRREAEDAAARAFAVLSPERQAEILSVSAPRPSPTQASRYWLQAPPGGPHQLNGRPYRSGQFLPGTTLFTHGGTQNPQSDVRPGRPVPPVLYDPPTPYAPLPMAPPYPDPNLGATVEQIDGTHAMPVPQTVQQTVPGAPQSVGGEPFATNQPPPDPRNPSEPAQGNLAAGAPQQAQPQYAGPPLERTPGLPPDEAVLEIQSQMFAHQNYPLLRDAYFQTHAKLDPVSGDIRSLTLSNDAWREMIPGFNGTNGPALANAAQFLSDQLFREALTNQAGKGNNRLMVLSGADSAPESGINGYLQTAQYPLILDKTPTNYEKLRLQFEAARAAGMEPEFLYVDQPAETAMGDMVERALAERLAGRPAKSVPLGTTARQNLDARRTALEVLFRNPEISARVVDGTGGKYEKRMITDRGEAANYLSQRLAEDERALPAGLERARQSLIARNKAGEVPADIVTAFLGEGWNIRPPMSLGQYERGHGTQYADTENGRYWEDYDEDAEWNSALHQEIGTAQKPTIPKESATLGNYWIDPEGNHHDLGEWGEHEKWLRRRGLDQEEAMNAGWVTGVSLPDSGGEFHTYGYGPLNSRQRSVVGNLAMRHRVQSAMHTIRGHNRPFPVKFERVAAGPTG